MAGAAAFDVSNNETSHRLGKMVDLSEHNGVVEKVGELRGRLSALERQVDHNDVSTNERLGRLETKVEEGFLKLQAMVENIYATLAQGRGAAFTLDYLVRLAAPFGLGILAAAIAAHFGWMAKGP